MSDKIMQAAYDCKYNGTNCSPNIVRVVNRADRQLPIGYAINTSKLTTDWQTYIPKDFQAGTYDAAGNYQAQH
jgi:hypothetical protein